MAIFFWGGIIPMIPDLLVFLPAAFYGLGRYQGSRRKRLNP